MLEQPRKINHERKLNIEFKKADVENLPFPDNYFDVIISKHVLHHIPNLDKTLNEAHRCLKKDGVLIIALNSDKNKPNVFKFEKYFGKKYGFNTFHGQEVMSIEKIQKHLKKFKDVKMNLFESKVEITKPELYSKYFMTFSELYEPEQTEEVCNKIETELNELVEREIKQNGKFTEKLVIGIASCRK